MWRHVVGEGLNGSPAAEATGNALGPDYDGDMVAPPTRAALLESLAGVRNRLAEPKLTQKRRLVLLRRQAELGDRRDRLDVLARRDRAR